MSATASSFAGWFTSGLSGVEVHPREVFRDAILDTASAVILAHNHPSGDPSPSRQDIELTSRLRLLGDLHGIAVLDHFIAQPKASSPAAVRQIRPGPHQRALLLRAGVRGDRRARLEAMLMDACDAESDAIPPALVARQHDLLVPLERRLAALDATLRKAREAGARFCTLREAVAQR